MPGTRGGTSDIFLKMESSAEIRSLDTKNVVPKGYK